MCRFAILSIYRLRDDGGKQMKCPFCGHENTRVIDSRPAEENNSIRRRRVCDECDKRFTTYATNGLYSWCSPMCWAPYQDSTTSF